MILNIVTNHPNELLNTMQFIFRQWDVAYIGEIERGIHEYSLTANEKDICLSAENLLELGVEAWNIRIR